MKNLKEAKATMNDFLNTEVEKSPSFVRQRTYNGGPRAAKVLAYKLKNSKRRHQYAGK